jgi:cytochrome c-type biogenesis protein CcmH
MIWVFIALMTGAAVLAVLWPLTRRARDARQAGDVAVYKDQLEEIERDQSFGLIAAPEAEAARIEVSRRLLAADGAARGRKIAAESPRGRRRAVAAVALVLVPAGAIATYLVLGSPDLPGQPLAARTAQAQQPGGDQSVAAMFARVEQHLAANPDDGRGWEVVAPIYMRLGRYDDAVKARQNVLRVLGPTAGRWSDLGEALVALANGVVAPEAKEAFDNALKIDPKDVMARFYSGLAAEQNGHKEDAARIWKALAADAPPGAEWLTSVQRALARVDPAAAATANTQPSPGQNDMIRAMVERLAARLKQDGSNVDGWIQLVRSYTVLGDGDKARAAAADARAALANEPEKLARLDAGLKPIAAALAPSANDEAAQQERMIRGMVERLAARLREDGSDVDGWLRLLRSYMVLGEADKARAAAAEARNALKGDADKLRRLDEGAKSLGVGG